MKPKESIAYLLPRFSVGRPVTVVMLLCAIVVVGYISYSRIPLSLTPEGQEGSVISVFVSYPNASPRDVEEKITRKIEDAIGTIPHVESVRSFSNRGSSNVRVQFQGGSDMKLAYANLRDRMDRVMPDMPDDVIDIGLRRWDQGEEAIIYLVAALPPDVEDAYYRIETFVQPALQRIEGVAAVEVSGIQRREIRIDLIEERVRSHRIDPARVAAILRDQNLALSGGFVFDGGRKIYVRSAGRFTGPEEVANIIIDPARRLRLSDIAEVSNEPAQRQWVYRVDQRAAIGLEVMRESTGNIERISRETQATLEELRQMPQLAGITFNVFSDQGDTVRESINNLKSSGMWGGIFAAVILYSFLRAPRLTGILTLSIPLSLLCTIIVLYFMGWSLNMATMMGLLLSIGMVIDNAIVIVENIYRLRQEGVPATEAAISGAGEVGLAVVTATLTSVVVFLPLILMTDEAEFSFWMFRIGIPVISSLLASLFIALIFVPLAAQRFSRGHHHAELRPVAWMRRHYERGLRWVLLHRLDAALIVALTMATIWFPISHVSRQQGGNGNQGNMRLNFELPSGTDIEDAEKFFAEVEQVFADNADRYNVDRIETRFRNNGGRVQARFRTNTDTQWYHHLWDSAMQWAGVTTPPLDRFQIEADFRQKFPLPPGITIRNWGGGGGGGQPTEESLTINLYGEDTGILVGLAEEALRRLSTIPGVLSVETDLERGGDELRVQLDRDRSRQLGINPQAVSSTISATLRAYEAGRYYAPDGRELSMRVQLGDVENQTFDDLRSMTFRTPEGIEIPIESLAQIQASRTLGQIRRENRQTMLSVTARIPRSGTSQLFEQVDQAMAGFQMPRGYRWDKGARYVQLQESNQAQKFALLLAVTFVFLLMGLLFESFVLPLAVIIAVPFSFLGVYWTLYLTGTSMDNMALIGTVILVGVVVNNAIVLVDLTNRLRSEGMERFRALMEAGRHRFRPILMTTATTVCGLIPMAVGSGGMGGMSYAPLGRTMIGGLMMATILTLVIVPLFYTFFDDLREYFTSIARSAVTPSEKLPASGAQASPAGK